MSDHQHDDAASSHHDDNASLPKCEKEMRLEFIQADSGVGTLVAKAVVNRPWAIAVVCFLKKGRTKVAIILAIWCVAESVYYREQPFTLAQPNVWVVIGLLLIAGGLAFRLAALGCIRKKEQLATHGVYSLCRHPLYLGSVMLAYGFCTLLGSVDNFVLLTIYFVVFYPLTILWEESRLAVRYGDAHQLYHAQTPMLLPFGAFRSGKFTWQAAMSRGGTLLLSAVVILLASVQVMAEVMFPK